MHFGENIESYVVVFLLTNLLVVASEKHVFICRYFMFVLFEEGLVLDELHGFEHEEFGFAESSVSGFIKEVILENTLDVNIAFDDSGA